MGLIAVVTFVYSFANLRLNDAASYIQAVYAYLDVVDSEIKSGAHMVQPLNDRTTGQFIG